MIKSIGAHLCRPACLGALVLLLGLALCGCRRAAEPASTGDEAIESTLPLIRVGHVGHDHQLALYAAALLGEELPGPVRLACVREREVYDLFVDGHATARLRLIRVGGGSAMPAAMERGEIDLGLGGVMPVARLVDRGAPIRVIAPLQTDGDMLVMQPDLECWSWDDVVALARRADRRPLRIGYKSPTAVAKLILERGLAAEGIACGLDPAAIRSGVLLVNFNGESGWAALMEADELDGFVMNQPAAALAEHRRLGRVACDLSELPPAGAWRGHPCCCVAATQAILTEQGPAVAAFVTLLRAATEAVNADKTRAAALAAGWTGNALEVELPSVASINYLCEPTEAWLAGMDRWFAMMDELTLFKGTLAGLAPREAVEAMCDFTQTPAAPPSADAEAAR